MGNLLSNSSKNNLEETFFTLRENECTRKTTLFLKTFFCAPVILKKLLLIKAGHYRHSYFTYHVPRKENLLMGQFSWFFFQRKTKRTISLQKITGSKISVGARVSIFITQTLNYADFKTLTKKKLTQKPRKICQENDFSNIIGCTFNKLLLVKKFLLFLSITLNKENVSLRKYRVSWANSFVSNLK